jgi:hypothetical protein
MCNCGKGRPAIPGTGPSGGGGSRSLPGTGPSGGGGSRSLPVQRAIPPSTVAPMPSVPVPQPRSRGVIPIRRAVALPSQHIVIAPVVIPSPPQRSRGVQPAATSHGIDTAIWGAAAWYILHNLAELAHRVATESGEDRLAGHWSAFVEAVAISIPCPTCARHFRIWMGWVPFEATVAATIVRARFVELHNMVNRTNKVPVWSGDLSEAYTGTISDIRNRITAMRDIIGEPMLNAAEGMLTILGV